MPHFWHKRLAEDRLEEQQGPFVALRPGAFLDQAARFGGDPFAKRQLTWFGSSEVPMASGNSAPFLEPERGGRRREAPAVVVPPAPPEG